MVTTSAPALAADATDHQARERHLAACARTLEVRGWQQRLAPLAETLVRLHLVHARNEHGTPVRRLDAQMLRETLCRLLREGDHSAAC
jgi:hypothetical protein